MNLKKNLFLSSFVTHHMEASLCDRAFKISEKSVPIGLKIIGCSDLYKILKFLDWQGNLRLFLGSILHKPENRS